MARITRPKDRIAHLTDEAIKEAFEGTNFGREDYDVILAEVVVKRAAGYWCGHTATYLAEKLGLISPKTHNPTKAGYEWACEVFYSRRERKGATS
ncbi:hypothetical protein [Acinetobacter phage ABPH49]|nr:hypothetical protein [Acinetobacter phage ABPH49]